MTPLESETSPLSPWWRRSVLMVMAFGFSVLLTVTALTYSNAPPIPDKVTGESGMSLFTGADILRGQEIFLRA